MSILTQYSRIQHHTITDGESNFTIPVTEDFTSGSWSSTDLVKSEFGINEANKTVFIRIGDEIIPLGGSAGNATLQQVVNNGNELSGQIIATGYGIAINYTPEEGFQNLFIQADVSFIAESPYTNRGSLNMQQMIDPTNPSYSVGMGWAFSESPLLSEGTASFIPTLTLLHFRGPSGEEDDVDETYRMLNIDDTAFAITQYYGDTSGTSQEVAIIGITKVNDFLGGTSSVITMNVQKSYGTYSWISGNDCVAGNLVFNSMEVSQIDDEGNKIKRNRVRIDTEKVQIETDEFQMNNKTGFTGTFSSSGLWEFENGILISFTDV